MIRFDTTDGARLNEIADEIYAMSQKYGLRSLYLINELIRTQLFAAEDAKVTARFADDKTAARPRWIP